MKNWILDSVAYRELDWDCPNPIQNVQFASLYQLFPLWWSWKWICFPLSSYVNPLLPSSIIMLCTQILTHHTHLLRTNVLRLQRYLILRLPYKEQIYSRYSKTKKFEDVVSFFISKSSKSQTTNVKTDP